MNAAIGHHIGSLLEFSLDASTDLALWVQPDGRLWYANQALCRALGIERTELLAGSVHDLSPAWSREAWALHWDIVQRQRSCCFDTQLYTRSGHLLPVNLAAHYLQWQGQHLYFALGRPAAEQQTLRATLEASQTRLLLQNQVLTALPHHRALGGQDWQAGLRLLTETAARTLDLHRVSLWLYTQDRASLHCLDSYTTTPHEHQAGGVLHQDAAPTFFHCLADGQPLTFRHALTDSRLAEISPSYLAPADVQALLMAPIWAGGHHLGVMFYEYCHGSRPWALEEENFASALAELVALVLIARDRHQIEDHAGRSEAWYRAVIQHSSDWIQVLAADGTSLYESPAVETITGYPAKTFLGSCQSWETIHPEDRPAVEAAFQDCLAHPATQVRVTYRFRHRQGHWIYLEACGCNLLEEPSVQGIVVHTRDVTLQEEARQALQEARSTLERRVNERTQALQQAVSTLQTQIQKRRHAEEAMRRSEARFHLLVEQAAEGIYLYDLQGHILDVNQYACDTLGYTREEMLRMTVSEVDATWTSERIAQEWPYLVPGEPLTVEGCGRRKDGSTFPVEVRVGLLELYGEQLVLALVRDITERKQAEEELQEAKVAAEQASAYLTTVIDNLGDGLLVTDADGQVARYNPALAALFETRLTAAKLATDAALTKEIAKLALSSSRCDPFPYLRVRDLGIEVAQLAAATIEQPGDLLVAEIPLDQGRVGKAVATAIHRQACPSLPGPAACAGAVILVRDITEDKELDQMKTDFISTVSHELRTPLTSVLGFAKIIQKKLEEVVFPQLQGEDRKLRRTVGQIEENLRIIISEGERLTLLINDVLDIAKMEAGRMEWQQDALGVNAIVQRAAAATQALFTQKNLPLRLHLAEHLPNVVGDRDRLLQVVINLLSNAVKFTDQGEITLTTRPAAGAVQISVTDTGVGIARADQDMVFERFRQVGNTLTDKPKGTGLGLPICKHIVEHHGGRIWVESELGQGSTFHVLLPIEATRSATRLDLDHLLHRLRHQAGRPCQSGDHASGILVVDDDPAIRVLLRQALEAEGYRVLEAADGVEALVQVRQHQPSLIILDVMMPRVNGFDVVAVLKRDPQTRPIPIIILSILEDADQGYRLGIDHYLTKPFAMEDLLAQVNSLLKRGRLPQRVLIVDEHRSIPPTLTEALQDRGCEVTQVQSSPEAVAQALAWQPDMIIADTSLDRQYDLVKTLRWEKRLDDVMFLLTGDHDHDPA
ncbi:MAG: PAS domain S-box protein [Gloeomargaritaceae cyanobacterium C42_A2020_066]|nr:PAS domain S-box protein [Gloeomargaritaceae cyanobacterium C42_A2020_066]